MKRHHLLLALAWLATQTACPMDEDDDGAGDDETSTSVGSTAPSPTTDDEGSSSSAPVDPTSSSDEGSDGALESSTTGSETTGALLYTVSGTVRLGAEVELVGDGIGNLFIGAFATCGHGDALLGVAFVPGADVSDGAEVPFELAGLPSGSIQLAYFLDDDGDADPSNPVPDGGDPAYAEDGCDGILSCVAIAVADADVTDVELELDLVHPECRH